MCDRLLHITLNVTFPLLVGLAYAVYTTLPVAFAGIARATKRMLPQPLQRGQV